jgi:hypothetical protein
MEGTHMNRTTCPRCNTTHLDIIGCPKWRHPLKVGDRVTFNGGFPGTVIEIYSPGMIVVRGERGVACIPAEDAVKA